MSINEVIKLLDNNEIILIRGDVRVPQSVFDFINMVFRLGKDPGLYAQKATHQDILRLLKSTELSSFLDENFEIIYIDPETLIPSNYWVDLYRKLSQSQDLISDILFFYRQQFRSVGRTEEINFLTNIWSTHRNLIYQLSSLILIHLLGMQIVKERQC